MNLVDQYPQQAAMPPVCYLCGAAPRTNNDHPEGERVIETGKYIEFEGFMFICETCWEEGARLLGWFSPKVKEAFVTDIADLRLLVDDLQGRLDTEQEANRVLANDVIGRYVTKQELVDVSAPVRTAKVVK